MKTNTRYQTINDEFDLDNPNFLENVAIVRSYFIQIERASSIGDHERAKYFSELKNRFSDTLDLEGNLR